MPIYFGGALILGAFVWFFCAYLCYVTAGQKHRRPITWLILGIFFGPFAFAAIYLMPKGHLVPAHSGSGPAADHGSTAHDATGHDAPDHGSTSHEHAHHTETKSQADLYEVPNKHKH